MTNDEFSAWLDYHTTAFPSIGDWLGNHTGQLGFWRKALMSVSLEHAKAATDAIFTGSISKPPGFGSHPSAVRRYAREQQPERDYWVPTYDGEAATRCPVCADSGMVSVWHPVLVRFLDALYGDQVPSDWTHRDEVRRGYNNADATYRTRNSERIPSKLPAQHWLDVACSCDQGRVKSSPTRRHGRDISGEITYDDQTMLRWSDSDVSAWIGGGK